MPENVAGWNKALKLPSEYSITKDIKARADGVRRR